MGFIEFVPEDLRERVGALLLDDVMSYEDKIDYLTGLIEDKEILSKVLMCLEKPKIEPPGPETFLALMTGQRQILAKWALDKGDFTNLEKYVSHEEEAVQLAYTQWKQKYDKVTFTKTETTKPNKSLNHPQKPDESENEDDEKDNASCHFESFENPVMIELFNSFPDGATLLILGCTGTGKSTFINSLANYLKHSSFESANLNGVDVLIETSFDHISRNQYARQHIFCTPTIFVEQGESNENTEAGQSSTQFSRSYKFTWGPRGQQKTIRIIDTPGVNDVRGAEKDKENFKNTLKFLAGFQEIHAIIILLKANDSRTSQAFRYCINELLAHLHESASKNIIFCFTHNITPEDTLATLETHLEALEKTKNIKIPLTENNMFCFENDSFRALCAMTKNVALSPSELTGHKRSWARSVQEAIRMFNAIEKLPVHRVNDTLSVNNIREVILALARPLAEISRELITNRKLIDDKEKEIEKCIADGTDLRGKLYIQQQVTRVQEIDYPMTVCNSCASYEKFSPTDGEMQKVFPIPCHNHCYLEGVDDEVYPNPALRNCWAFVKETCRVCSHPWQTHMHIWYNLIKTMEPFIDQSKQTSIDDKEQQIKEARDFKAKLENRRNELKNESEKVCKFSAEFAAFQRKESLLSYNDAYGDYINCLIQEEHDKVSLGGSDEMLKKLEKYRYDYVEEVKILTKHNDDGTASKPVEEIYRLVEELKTTTSFGTLLQNVQNIEFLTVRNHNESKSVIVNLNSGSFASKVKMESNLVSTYRKLFEEKR